MGEIKKIEDEYYIEFEARGLKYQQKVGPDRARAEKALARVERMIREGEVALIVRDVEVGIFFQDFLENARKEHTVKTRGRFEQLLAHFRQFLSEQGLKTAKLSRLTPSVIERYKGALLKTAPGRGREVKPHIVNFTLFLLRDVFEYALKLGYLNDNPTLHIRTVSPRPFSSDRSLSMDEYRRLAAHLSEEERRMADWMVATGMRFDELGRMMWADINRKDNVVRVRPPEGVADGERVIPLSPTALDILEAAEREGPDEAVFGPLPQSREGGRDAFKKALVHAARQAGISRRVGVMSLRHTFARQLFEKGITLGRLYKLMGYDDIAKTMPHVSSVLLNRIEREDYFSL